MSLSIQITPIEDVDHVYIDTSVFEENNFFMGHKIKELLRLGEEGEIVILMPKITYMDIIKRMEVGFENAASGFKVFKDKSRIIKNSEEFGSMFLTIDFNKIKDELLK